MKLHSMELTKEEREPKQASVVSPESDGPLYPWGLGLHLDDQVLGKLKLDGLPKVGTYVLVQARAKVTGAMENEHEHGKHRTAQLQIVDLGLGEVEEEKADPADKLYGKG